MSSVIDRTQLDPPPNGMFVARLTCGHDFGPGSGYKGPAAKPGETVRCWKEACRETATRDDLTPADFPTVLDVVYAGPETTEARRW